MIYIAHKDGEREQTVLEHLTGTAKLSAAFADVFGASEEGFRCGLLHDVGKYSEAFQRRIRGDAEKPDHATAGALEAAKRKDTAAAFCIAGHHGGLPNLGNRKADTAQSPTLFGKLKRKPGEDIGDYSSFRLELPELPNARAPQELAESELDRYFYIKMLYSCLVDADFLDTEAFMSGDTARRGGYDGLDICWDKLRNYIAPWWKAESELNELRCSILRALINSGAAEKGLFSLTVPTGGGKTIGSMAFALEHAKAHGMKRIIYVIPYTSIIEQTQTVFEQVFGTGSVVAHYANADYGNDTDAQLKSRQYLSAENWDAPVILTTAVQFFESLYAAKSSRCRKLHNIAGSVIILDEAQMLPVPYLTACTASIAQLVKNYGCSAVLCTATQPALSPLFEKLLPGRPIRELCPRTLSESKVFRRVVFKRDGRLSDAELAARLNNENQALCIVNSRKQAQKIFALLDGEGAFLLSTMMYPENRRAKLREIRDRLKSGLPCRVVSTSLIEAGVDADFPTVHRAVAGLDSILQAAGRCNREGKRPAGESIVHIFETEQSPPEALRQNVAAAMRTLERAERVDSAEAIHDYFDFLLYRLKDEAALDSRRIIGSIESGAMAFRDIGERFRIIDGCECTVYIPLGAGRALTDELARGKPTIAQLRKLGRYSVGVYENHFRQLVRIGAVQQMGENFGVLRDTSLYSDKTGLSFGIDEGKGRFT